MKKMSWADKYYKSLEFYLDGDMGFTPFEGDAILDNLLGEDFGEDPEQQVERQKKSSNYMAHIGELKRERENYTSEMADASLQGERERAVDKYLKYAEQRGLSGQHIEAVVAQIRGHT